MGLLEDAMNDIADITSDVDSGWGSTITFTPVGRAGDPVTVNGLHTKHHMKTDTEGAAVNGKNAHVSVSEQLLIAQAYPVRNPATKEVAMKGDKVEVKDSTGESWTYTIDEVFPDETIGLIVCILSDYE